MRFFMLYSNQFAVGNKPIGIASLAAILRREGHEFTLFDCTAFDVVAPNKADWNAAGEQTLAFKLPSNPQRLPSRRRITFGALIDEVLRAVDGFGPDVIGLSALTDDYPLGLGLMRRIKQMFPRVPTIAGGVHATVDPEGVIAEPCFDMVCVGEGEYVALDIGRRLDEGKGCGGIANLWVKCPDGTIEKNAVRPYETDLDRFPFPDWSIYPETAFYKPFQGFVYKYGDFEMSRGCPYKCSYCINVELQQIYAGHQYHRTKSIARVVAEVRAAIERYGIEFLKFWDETFLLMEPERLEEFGDLYSREIGLPYVIETTAQSVDARSVKVLQKTNCRSASLGMETGSPDMRRGLLFKPTGNDAYVKAFALLEAHGIQKVSFNMIGLPTESQEDIFRTIALNRLVRTDAQAVGVFYPYKGTPIRQMMIQEGWMDDDFDLGDLKDYDYNTFTSGARSVVRFTDMDSRLVNRLRVLFSAYVVWPGRLHPILDYVKNHDDTFARTLLRNVQRISYAKRFGEPPPRDSGAEQPDREKARAAALAAAAAFGEPDAAEFAGLLVEGWSGNGFDRVVGLLARVATAELPPDVPIPDSEAGLLAWLMEDRADGETVRDTQRTLIQIAKSDSRKYVPASA
ncbi:MAG: B12-binding domain-containing radical SAM protein [Acidimicrobiia bacterium]|nr:B12-binding domain-containing radical SAM protein [Acidimicrobiia bacterium]